VADFGRVLRQEVDAEFITSPFTMKRSTRPVKKGRLMEGKMDPLERAMNHLGEALLVAHGLMNPIAGKSECTKEELAAREIYSHIHWAIKILVDGGGNVRDLQEPWRLP
jgi:hypothetical protein